MFFIFIFHNREAAHSPFLESQSTTIRKGRRSYQYFGIVLSPFPFTLSCNQTLGKITFSLLSIPHFFFAFTQSLYLRSVTCAARFVSGDDFISFSLIISFFFFFFFLMDHFVRFAARIDHRRHVGCCKAESRFRRLICFGNSSCFSGLVFLRACISVRDFYVILGSMNGRRYVQELTCAFL